MSEPEIEIGERGPLTPREAEAVLWTAQGKTAWEAGTILGVSSGTLNAHVANAAAKLHASNRAHLVARAFVIGVLVVAAAKALFWAIALLGDGRIYRRHWCKGPTAEIELPRASRGMAWRFPPSRTHRITVHPPKRTRKGSRTEVWTIDIAVVCPSWRR